MDFVNETGVPAGWTMGFDPDGRERIIVVIKATFGIPEAGADATLLEEQAPLVDADRFTGEPGLSAPLYESDYAHRKVMCDVLLNGSAYAAQGSMTRRLAAGFRAGPLVKTFAVVGERRWQKGLFGMGASEPEPFDVMAITYNVAFGGAEVDDSEPGRVDTYVENPVGVGFGRPQQSLVGKALPNTEELDRPVIDSRGPYRPMALGPLGRNWAPRARYAGTYSKNWLAQRAPFWPEDFDYRYFQAAPPDQQIPFPRGGEEVALKNLTPDGHVAFRLPALAMPVWFLPHRGKDTRIDADLDSILIEPDLGRFMLGWRATLAMRRSCFDIRQVVAGHRSEAWQRARKYGRKPYYRGLAELVASRRRARQE